jgi:hypothetical protein
MAGNEEWIKLEQRLEDRVDTKFDFFLFREIWNYYEIKIYFTKFHKFS